MTHRRVVTGHDDTGKSVVVSDGPIRRSHRMRTVPGLSTSLSWSTEAGEPVPARGADPTDGVASYVPEAGGTRFIVLSLPPDEVYTSEDFDPAGAAVERKQSSPGLAELFESDNPGMHRTPTVDYGIVLSGEIWLELDDGKMTLLRTGDIVVQNGTRHAWRNKSDGISTLAFVLIGASGVN